MSPADLDLQSDAIAVSRRLTRALFRPFAHGPAELTLCFQKEVADRMVAPQGDRVRSRISMMVQHCCEATVAYALPRTVFVPAPMVDAAVVQCVDAH